MLITDSFGFLNYSLPIEFNGGQVIPATNFDSAHAWVIENKNEDGFIYPPLEQQELDKITLETGKRKLSTKRPVFLHKMPPSHTLTLVANRSEKDNLRGSDSGFIIQLLSYIFGTRLQFHDWWFDSRIPTNATHSIHFPHPVIEDFLSHSYKTWSSWNKTDQKLFTNILYMYSRARSYEWDWERFLLEYIVFDAAFSLAKKLYGCRATSHKL